MLIGNRPQLGLGHLDRAAVEAVRLSSGMLGIPTFRQALVSLRWEISRARRYGRPLSTAALSPARSVLQANGASPAAGEMQQRQVAFFMLGSLLRDVLRETDVLTFAAEANVYAVFMLETDAESAERAIRRLAQTYASNTGLTLGAGLASFPADALTGEELLNAALARLQSDLEGESNPASLEVQLA